MVDEQERCEWVNVSSGASSPGYSWTKGRKMIVCVSVLPSGKKVRYIDDDYIIDTLPVTND